MYPLSFLELDKEELNEQNRQTGGLTGRQTDKRINGQADRWTEEQPYKQTHGQTDRKTDTRTKWTITRTEKGVC